MGDVTWSATRRRVFAVVVSAFVTGLAFTGLTVILPLYATEQLGLSNAQFARVLSLRMTGITVGVIFLGALSDRFGTRRFAALALVGGGLGLGLLGMVPVAGFLILIPVISGLLSTAFVNLNHLTQVADPARPGRSNTLYRASGTLAGILAPVVVTRLLGYSAWVFAAGGLLLCLGGLALRGYPRDENHEPFQGWPAEARLIAGMYRSALGQPHLMRYIHLSLVWNGLTAAVTTFVAIRLTKELAALPALYGNACSIGFALTLGGILALGAVLDRSSVKWWTVGLSILGSLCLVGAGLTDSAGLTAVCFVVYTIATGVMIAPLSMWIGREGERVGLSTAFSVHKVFAAAYLAVATFGFGFLEPVVGIRTLFLICGLLTVPVLVLMARLREPQADAQL